MTPEQKQSELDRHRAIILATLAYNYEREVGRIVFDGDDRSIKSHEQQKIKIEKYYQQCRLDKLQQRLSDLTKILRFEVNLNFSSYIKETTGYDLDLFEGLPKRVETIIAQNEIRNDNEGHDITIMLNYNQQKQTSTSKQMDKKLWKLLSDYASVRPKSKTCYSEIISEVEVDGVIETVERFSTGPKPELWEDEKIIAPDGKRKLRITRFSSGEHASTAVDIHFDTPNGSAGGSIYSIDGIHRDVKAFWKDNHTIVIETRKDYIANTKRRLVSSFGDSINIEYLEN